MSPHCPRSNVPATAVGTLSTRLPLLGLCLAMIGGSSHAGASPASESLHKQALAAAQEGKYVSARKLWEQAYAVEKDPRFLYNLGRMAEELDQPVEALARFEAFLKVTLGAEKFASLRRPAETRATALLKRIATIEVVAKQNGALVLVDASPVGIGPIHSSVRVAPGEHMVTARLMEHHAFTRVLRLEAGTKRTIVIELARITPLVLKPRFRYLMPRWIPWTLLSVGLAMAAGGGASLGVAQRSFDDFDQSVIDENLDESLKRRGEMSRDLGTALLVIGVALTAGGIVTAILNRPTVVEGEKPPASTSWRLFATPGGVGLAAQF